MVRKKFSEEQTNIKKKPHVERQVVVSRAEWEAREPKEPLPPVPVPVQYVVVTWTDTEICEWPEACKKTVKSVQTDHMDNLGLPDIRYNFLVGTDKQMYEGRGWGMAGPTYPETIVGANEINGKSIEIALIDKHMTTPSADLSDTITRFLAKELYLNNVCKPLEFKGILNNKFVRFSKLFQGEIIHECMLDEDDRAAMNERERVSREMMEEQMKIAAERKSAVELQVEAILAAQRETIKTKTPEEIRVEYGFTEGVDVTTIKREGLPEYEDIKGMTKQ